MRSLDYPKTPHYLHPGIGGKCIKKKTQKRQFRQPRKWLVHTHPFVLFGRQEAARLGMTRVGIFLVSDTSPKLWRKLSKLSRDQKSSAILYRGVTGGSTSSVTGWHESNCKHTDVSLSNVIPLRRSSDSRISLRGVFGKIKVSYSHDIDEEHFVLFMKGTSAKIASLARERELVISYAVLNQHNSGDSRNAVFGLGIESVILVGCKVPRGYIATDVSQTIQWRDAQLATRTVRYPQDK